MANNLTDAGEALVLTWLMSNGAATRPTAWYASLHVGAATEASPQTNEVSTSNGYARQAVGGASGFTVSGTAPTQGVNPALLTFGPNTTTNWGVVDNAGIWSTASGSTGSLWTGVLAASKTVAIGDSLTIAASALVVQLD
jgi:hypothetical protein